MADPIEPGSEMDVDEMCDMLNKLEEQLIEARVDSEELKVERDTLQAQVAGYRAWELEHGDVLGKIDALKAELADAAELVDQADNEHANDISVVVSQRKALSAANALIAESADEKAGLAIALRDAEAERDRLQRLFKEVANAPIVQVVAERDAMLSSRNSARADTRATEESLERVRAERDRLSAQVDELKASQEQTACHAIKREEMLHDQANRIAGYKAQVDVAENACALHEDVAKRMAVRLNEMEAQVDERARAALEDSDG